VAPGVGVEGALADEAVDAGFGAQEAVGVFAADLDRGALDAGHFAFGFFEQFDLETLALAIAQVHPFEHAGPVLGFGAAGAGLDFDEARVAVHRVVEHAAEFEFADAVFKGGGVGFDGLHRFFVVFRRGKVEQIPAVGQTLIDFLQIDDDAFEGLLFLAEFLGAGGVVPDFGVFELFADFDQFFGLGIVVKDTSEVLAPAP
jgi:hypothetical protein